MEREELSYDYVDENVEGLKGDIEKVFSNHERIFCNNKDNLARIK